MQTEPMRHRLVCFDAGFTLLRPRQEMWQRLARVLADHGHAPTEAALHAAWETADAWFWRDYHRDGNTTWTNDTAIEETWRSYHRLMLGELGLADEQHRLLDAILESQFAPDAWELYPDVLPALAALDVSQPRPIIGIVSDWGSRLPEIVALLGLDRYVDFVLASGAIGLAKPAPEFFLLACERAGVTPDEAVMVGDSLRADVRGARAAGMEAVLLDRTGAADTAEVGDDVAVIRTLDDLYAALSRGVPSRLPKGAS